MIAIDSDFETTEAKEGGQFDPPEPGGQVMIVLEVSEKPSKAGNDMVTLSLDIAEGEHAGAFQKFPKKFFQQVNGDNLAYFKAMINYFAASNPANKMNQVIFKQKDESLGFDGSALVGMRVGANLREAEYQDQQGAVKVGIEVGHLCAVRDVPNLKPMPLKKFKGARTATAAGRPAPGRPAGGPPPAEDDLPF
jgi:hypothetical protein